MTEMHLRIPRNVQAFEEVETYNKILADPLSVQIATRSLIAMMQYLADVWIDSGKSGNGEERADNPSRRNVTYEPPAETPFRCLKIVPDTDTSGWNVFPFPPASISNLFYRFVGNEARWPQIHEDGTQSLKELVFGFTTENPYASHRVALRGFGMKIAMHWFAKLLDSPFSRQLARCDDCGTYFAYDRAPRKEIYGGIHCKACKHHRSAKWMESSRDRWRKTLACFMVDAAEQLKAEPEQDLLKLIAENKKRITATVIKRLTRTGTRSGKDRASPYEISMSGRWITEKQNWKAIKDEFERRKNGTQKAR